MRLINGDCLEVLKDMEDNSVTAIVTDPPYGLKFMGKKWDYDVPSVEVWEECLRVLKPGGTLLCFAGTRTQHRMAVNIEDSGFVLKDTLMYLFGVGFPKAADISKHIDKKLGNEREVVGEIKAPGLAKTNVEQGEFNRSVYNFKKYSDNPASEESAKWEGYKSHGLKPAYEPILLAMKPNEGSYADNAMKHGVAGLNIDESRVETKDKLGGGALNSDSAVYAIDGFDRPWMHDKESLERHKNTVRKNVKKAESLGRFPANIIHDGSEQVVSCFPETGKSSGGRTVKRSGGGNVGSGKKSELYWSNEDPGYGDSGSASRYFKSCPILDEDIETQRIFYTAKASKKERNKGLDGFEPKDNLGYEVDPEHPYKSGKRNDNNTDQLYMAVTGKLPTKKPNHHPTVKPKKLMEYLVGLVKMPENTVILDPFMGSGTTGIACVNNNVDFIGIELEPEYFEIAKARIGYDSDKQVDKQLSIWE